VLKYNYKSCNISQRLEYNNKKQSTFPSDWNTTINKPSTFNPDLTNVYTKTEVNNISTLTNFYNKTSTDTLLAGKEAVLTFSTPLTRTLNAISIDLSAYQPTLTFNSPMTKTANNVSIDLSSHATTTALNGKENILTFSAPLTRTTNTIGIDLSSYLTSAVAASTYATITNINTVSTNMIDLSSYLSSAVPTGDLSFNGTLYSGAISTGGGILASSLTLGSAGDIITVRNVTASGTVSANSFTEGGVTLNSIYLRLSGANRMTGN
jgi:hypothetical protein